MPKKLLNKFIENNEIKINLPSAPTAVQAWNHFRTLLLVC